MKARYPISLNLTQEEYEAYVKAVLGTKLKPKAVFLEGIKSISQQMETNSK